MSFEPALTPQPKSCCFSFIICICECAIPPYDLPIAVGLLLASEQICGQVERALFVGELGLDGALHHTDGVLPMVSVAKSHGIETVYVPFEDAPEAGLVEGATVIPVKSLAELAAHLSGERPLPAYLAGPVTADIEVLYPVDFQDVKGRAGGRAQR